MVVLKRQDGHRNKVSWVISDHACLGLFDFGVSNLNSRQDKHALGDSNSLSRLRREGDLSEFILLDQCIDGIAYSLRLRRPFLPPPFPFGSKRRNHLFMTWKNTFAFFYDFHYDDFS